MSEKRGSRSATSSPIPHAHGVGRIRAPTGQRVVVTGNSIASSKDDAHVGSAAAAAAAAASGMPNAIVKPVRAKSKSSVVDRLSQPKWAREARRLQSKTAKSDEKAGCVATFVSLEHRALVRLFKL